MKTVRITALRRTEYPDLMEQYENPIQHACDVEIGQTFYAVDGEKPPSLCPEAWSVMASYVQTLAQGGGNFFDGWMKNPHSALISCNDGFRPVSFLLETVEQDETSEV